MRIGRGYGFADGGMGGRNDPREGEREREGETERERLVECCSGQDGFSEGSLGILGE